MTVNDIRKRIKEIEAKEGDDEWQHVLEGKLYIDVLEAIAEGDLYAKELAREALKARELDFSRWYAQ